MDICIIPARGGSKRLPRKNLLKFHGTPMVEIALRTAILAGCFDEVILSSEDSEILALGEIIPGTHLSHRPLELAGDDIRADDVIRWEIKNRALDLKDRVCCLLPTTPLLDSNVLLDAHQKFSSEGALFGVIETTETPFRSFQIEDNTDSLKSLFPKMLLLQSHEYPRTVVDAGQFYFATAAGWLENFSITASKEARGYLLDSTLAIDINYPSDWERLQGK